MKDLLEEVVEIAGTELVTTGPVISGRPDELGNDEACNEGELTRVELISAEVETPDLKKWCGVTVAVKSSQTVVWTAALETAANSDSETAIDFIAGNFFSNF